MFARAYKQRLSPCFVAIPRASVAEPLDSSTVVTSPNIHVDELGRFGRTSSVHQDADYQAAVYDRNHRLSGEGLLL
jgi:hypothetical protein